MVGRKLKKTKPPAPDDVVVKEMHRLRTKAVLEPLFRHLHDIPEDCIQIISQNIRSLNKNVNTVRNDSVFIKSHIVLLQETWIKAEADISQIAIQNKCIVARNMLSGHLAKGKGTIIYSAENPDDSKHFDRDSACNIDLTVSCYNKFVVINMYKSNNANIVHLKEALKKSPYLAADNVLLFGDFNDDLALSNCPTKMCLEQKYNLKLISPIQPTTDNLKTIDGVFGRLKDFNFQTYIYESYCSDHKPIIVRLTNKEVEFSLTGLTQTLNILNV